MTSPTTASNPPPRTPTGHHIDTILVSAGRPAESGAPLNHPVTAASNFSPGGAHWYSRSDGSDTVDAFETVIGTLEGGEAVAFGSGMAAVAAVLDIVPVGGSIIVGPDTYHGVSTLIRNGVSTGRWVRTVVDSTDLRGWTEAARTADMLWIESPSNPLLEILDLPSICGAKDRRAVVAVDSTLATPLFQKPIELGADFVVHSATKFIGGHSDLLAGVAASHRPELVEWLRARRTFGGATLGSLEAFLALRGLRTLSLRLERATNTAAELARRLQSHPSVRLVRYPGLPSDPGHTLASQFMEGYGAVVSFEVRDDEAADRVMTAVEVIRHATSLGGVETTAERRSGYPGSDHVPAGLIRMSVGVEHVDDLWDDLDAALSASLTKG